MRRRSFHFIASLALLPAVTAMAQIPAQPSDLPMKNLQIEVRQQQPGMESRSGFGAPGGIVLQPGNSSANIGLSGGAGQRQEMRNLTQMMLVLNGRATQVN